MVSRISSKMNHDNLYVWFHSSVDSSSVAFAHHYLKTLFSYLHLHPHYLKRLTMFTYGQVTAVATKNACGNCQSSQSVLPPKILGNLNNDNISEVIKSGTRNFVLFTLTVWWFSRNSPKFKKYVVKFGGESPEPHFINNSIILYFEINKIKFSFTKNQAFNRLVHPKLKAGGCQR